MEPGVIIKVGAQLYSETHKNIIVYLINVFKDHIFKLTSIKGQEWSVNNAIKEILHSYLLFTDF
jgi:hypothetical protein